MSWRFQLLNKPYGSVTEGPVWDGENLLFTHISAGRIMRCDVKTDEITVWREGTNRTNGLAHDAEGRLFGCCSGGRAILRFDPDGNNVVIADQVEGKKLNTPNDLAVDRQGRVWFTNPWNATNIDATEVQELDHRAVLCATPQAGGSYSVARVATDSRTIIHQLPRRPLILMSSLVCLFIGIYSRERGSSLPVLSPKFSNPIPKWSSRVRYRFDIGVSSEKRR